MTKLEILRAARAYAEDPEHIVLDSTNIWETADGRRIKPELAQRGCVVGIVDIVHCAATGSTDAFLVERGAAKTMLSTVKTMTFQQIVEAGAEAILDTYTAAIELAEARAA